MGGNLLTLKCAIISIVKATNFQLWQARGKEKYVLRGIKTEEWRLGLSTQELYLRATQSPQKQKLLWLNESYGH